MDLRVDRGDHLRNSGLAMGVLCPNRVGVATVTITAVVDPTFLDSMKINAMGVIIIIATIVMSGVPSDEIAAGAIIVGGDDAAAAAVTNCVTDATIAARITLKMTAIVTRTALVRGENTQVRHSKKS